MLRSPSASGLALALTLLAAAPAWAQSGGVAGALGAAPPSGQALTVDDVFRGASAPPVLVAAHRASTGHWGARILDMLFNRRRGDPARAENSLAAIDAAFAAGAQVVEVDVRHTKDGALVLMHDEDIRRTTNGKGKVSDLTLSELRAVRLLPQGRIPTLEEALRAARGRVILDLDLKTDRIDLVVAALQAEHMVESVLVFDSNPALLRRGRALEPRLRVLPKGRNLAEVRALIAEFDPPAIHLEALDQLTPEVRAALAAANCRAWLNALGAKDVLACKRFYRKLARGGAQVIQTDRPARVLSALR